MAVDVRLTTRQALAVVELVAKCEEHAPRIPASFVDGHALRVLKNAALRIGAALALAVPEGPAASRARGIALRGLVDQLREIDAEYGGQASEPRRRARFDRGR